MQVALVALDDLSELAVDVARAVAARVAKLVVGLDAHLAAQMRQVRTMQQIGEQHSVGVELVGRRVEFDAVQAELDEVDHDADDAVAVAIVETFVVGPYATIRSRCCQLRRHRREVDRRHAARRCEVRCHVRAERVQLTIRKLRAKFVAPLTRERG